MLTSSLEQTTAELVEERDRYQQEKTLRANQVGKLTSQLANLNEVLEAECNKGERERAALQTELASLRMRTTEEATRLSESAAETQQQLNTQLMQVRSPR